MASFYIKGPESTGFNVHGSWKESTVDSAYVHNVQYSPRFHASKWESWNACSMGKGWKL